MDKGFIQQIKQHARNHSQQLRKSIVIGLAIVVSLCTVCELILPAVALEKNYDLPEQQHTEVYDSQVVDVQETEPTALVQSLNGHEHVSECYDAQGELICEYSDDAMLTPDDDSMENPENQFPEQISTDAYVKDEDETTVPAETVENTEGTEQTEKAADAQNTENTLVPTENTVTNTVSTEEITPTEIIAGDHIDVSPYITSASITYKLGTDTEADEWKSIEAGTILPGDTKLRININYDRIPIQTLIENQCKLQYVLPPILRNPVAQGEITSGGDVVGTIGAEGNSVTLTFKESWLNSLQDSGKHMLDGDFYAESYVNLSMIPEDGKTQIHIGGVTIDATFETDLIAKHGDVVVTKSVADQVIREENGDYLQYTLTATAGADGCPDVKVVDHFTSNAEYAEYENVSSNLTQLPDTGIPRETITPGKQHGSIYKGTMPTENNPIPPEGNTEITEPGSLIWTIGDMSPGEERTLTYRVRLKDGYTRLQNSGNKVIQNGAQVFSKTYQRDEATASFQPNAGLAMNKSHANAVRNKENGNYTITYTVWIEAQGSNNFIMDNVSVMDSLNYDQTHVDSKILPYLTYDPHSFKLYRSKDTSGELLQVNQVGGAVPKLTYAQDGKSFTLEVGNMRAGDAYCFQYDVIVGKEAFAVSNRQNLSIDNRVVAKSDNTAMTSKDFLQAYSDCCEILYDHWASKMVSNRLEKDMAIVIGKNVYDATGGTPVIDPAPAKGFIAPMASYPYSVTINALGDWDVTRAKIQDTIDNEHMQFVGYVQVDAFDTKVVGDDPLGKLVESRWVKVDKMNSFQFRLCDIGFENNQYAYRFTYFAKPVNVDDISSITVKNRFILKDIVISEGNSFVLDGVTSEVEVDVQGGRNFETNKYPWYYERPTVAEGSWSNGAIYWAIKIEGTEFLAGTCVKDYLKNETLEKEESSNGNLCFHNDSLVGVYYGSLPAGENFADYANMEELLAGGSLRTIPSMYYSAEFGNSLGLPGDDAFSEITLRAEISIDLTPSESVYIILKAEPTTIPLENRSYKTYTNYLSSSDDGKVWVERNQASKTLYGGAEILKELGRVITFDGENIQELEVDRGGAVPQEYLIGPGNYVVWAVKVNFAGTLSGRYRIVDEVPAGMETAFARLKWLGDLTRDNNTNMCRIDNYQKELGEGWTEHTITAETDFNTTVTSYYYTKGNQILWEVENLIAGNVGDRYSADFQIVCRVTDPDVLQGGQAKEFNNQVYLQTLDGIQMDSDANGVTIETKSIEKSAIMTENTIPFTIQLNPLGEDLIAGADTLTLIDEMSSTLELDLLSFAVVNTKTNKPVDFTCTFDEQVLKLEVPDSQPLTVSYKAQVVATPDTTVRLSNNAYWEGYSSTEGNSQVVEDFYYTVGGTAGGASSPCLKILKYDQFDATHYLEGAEFLMEEGTMVDGIFKPNGKSWSGVTDGYGMLVLGRGIEKGLPMSYNTVYCVKETQAPEGYVLDPTPYYFIVAAKEGNVYPEYPEGVYVHYESPVYTLSVSNHKGEIYVQKKFQHADGSDVEVIDGVYHFGLFDNAQGKGEPIQTVTLTFGQGVTEQKGTFSNLEHSHSYYIFELDDNGKPVLPGDTSYVDSRPFQVLYSSDSGIDVNAVSSGNTVTVTNRMCLESLPETGGVGTIPYATAGMVLLCGCAYLLHCRTKRRREEQ